MTRARVLVVDDDRDSLELCSETLKGLPEADIVLEQQSTRASERIRREQFDLVITDLRMPVLNGVELLRQARDQGKHCSMLVLTAYPEVETAIETIKLGAADYLQKPFDTRKFLGLCRDLLNRHPPSTGQVPHCSADHPEAATFEGILAQGTSMGVVIELIKRVAPVNVDVLIVGKTGTGKEMVARAIHRLSARCEGPFVAVNSSAIPSELMESELFGHERGAFTGAGSRAKGLLECAEKGTFFLDELHELPLPLQSKLLRVIQERKIRRVGGTAEVPVDIRFVSASALDLRELARSGRFREDLYYRLDVVRIDLPPLRDRPEDIPLLVEHFCQASSRRMARPRIRIGPDALEVLRVYQWPGNVRELQNVVERLTATRDGGVISLYDLPDQVLLSIVQ